MRWDASGGVYLDDAGRAVGRSDPSANSLSDVIRWAVLERRLSVRGLELVRAGQVELSAFLYEPAIDSRAELWAEPTVGTYERATYAVTGPIDSLPPAAQAVLRGHQRVLDPGNGFTVSQGWAPGSPSVGFEITASEAATLFGILDARGMFDWVGPLGTAPDAGPGWIAADEHMYVIADPIYPHGEPLPQRTNAPSSERSRGAFPAFATGP